MPASSNATIQQRFAVAILATLAELKGGQLRKFAEKGNAKGGESFTFYRMKSSKAKTGVPSMLADAHGNDGGDMENYKVMISEISVQQKVKESDMKKTEIDIKNAYVKSMANALLVREDEEVVTVLSAAVGTRAAGDNTKPITDMINIRSFISRIRSAHAGAQLTPDGTKGVVVAMNREDYEELSASEIFINGDYSNAFGGGTGDLPLTFFGAELALISSMNRGASLIIPSNSFGFAAWEDSANADAVYFPTDGKRWHLQTDESIGVLAIEPSAITKFAFKVGA